MTKPSRPLSNGREARSVVARGECPHRREGAHQRLVPNGFRAAGQHHVRVAATNRLPRLADGVAAGRTGGDDAEVGSLRSEEDRDHARCQVADGHRDEEGGHSIRPLLAHEQDLVGQSSNAADAGADDHAGSLGFRAFESRREPGLVHRLAGRHERQLNVAIVSALVFAIEDRRRIEILDLGGDAGGQPRGIELCDGTHARSAGNHSVPGGGDVEPESRQGAHTRDDNSGLPAGRAHRTSFPVRMVAAR